jgi:hypothetical protein
MPWQGIPESWPRGRRERCHDRTRAADLTTDQGSYSALVDSQRQRKVRLFSCGICRHFQNLITSERVLEALGRAERFAEGELSDATIEKWYRKVRKITAEPAGRQQVEEGINRAVQWACLPSRYGGYTDSWSTLVWQFRYQQKDETKAKEVEQIARKLLQCIFGNPASTIAINPTWLAWNDSTIPKIAQSIYDDRAFDRLPILADSLEDAGCNNAEILDHCRQPGPHVKGCWVVDALLGKE